MRIFLLELKKIWTPGSIIMLVGAAALYYWLYGYGPVQNFPNGTEAALNLELALEWRERFGSAIDVDELAQIDADFDAARAEFARDVSEIPEAVEEGVVSWGDIPGIFRTPEVRDGTAGGARRHACRAGK